MLTLLVIAKALCEVALLSLAGRGLLALMLARRTQGNLFYGVLHTVSQPFVRLAARLSPASISPRHHPWVAAALLGGLWLAATLLKIDTCLRLGVAACR